MDIVEDLASVFNRGDLVLVAEFLGLAPTSVWGPRKLTRAILTKIEESEDLPETDGSRGGDMFEDFIAAIMSDDEEGEKNEVKQEEDDDPVVAYLTKTGKDLPDCWSFADAADPACKKCGIFKWCAGERLNNLPSCYGVKYDHKDKACVACIEAPFCKEGTSLERRQQ